MGPMDCFSGMGQEQDLQALYWGSRISLLGPMPQETGGGPRLAVAQSVTYGRFGGPNQIPKPNEEGWAEAKWPCGRFQR